MVGRAVSAPGTGFVIRAMRRAPRGLEGDAGDADQLRH
jgi:hypothetical protein